MPKIDKFKLYILKEKKNQIIFDKKWRRLFAVIRENKWSSFSKEKYAIGCCYLLL